MVLIKKLKIVFACFFYPICNGNRTEWSTVRCVMIRVINKIGRPCGGSPICLITSMITDRIGLHSVLLPLLTKLITELIYGLVQ